MDLFDRHILAVLKDGKPRGFQQVLSEVDFSRNTLRLHLEDQVSRTPRLPRPNKELLWRSQSRTRPLSA